MSGRIIQRLAGMLVLVSVLFGTSWAAYAHTQGSYPQATSGFTFAPVADAYVIQTYPSRNYGSSTSLRADASPVTRSYLRFTVKGLNGGTIQSAKLRFYANSSNSIGITVSAVSNNTWTESGITYNNAPVTGTKINSSKSFSSGTWVEVDVSSYVKSAATYNVAVTTSSSTNINLSSREVSTKAPQLVVSALASTTATPTLAPSWTSTPALPTATLAPSNTPAPLPTSTSMPSPTPTAAIDWQPSWPIRAAFYYPWFPEAWTQLGIYPYTNYHPQLGFYSSTDSTVLKQHIAMMQYAGIQAGIASWWGQGSTTDVKIAGLLNAASGTNFRWALYYENESTGDPTAAQIQTDLTYIRDHYGNNPNFLRINGKFVVFVYAAGNDGCGMADRWKQGNTVGAYIVLKVFAGYLTCASQPDDWHQYSPAVAEDQQGSYSISISPGFWLVGNTVRLSRDLTRWTQNVKDLVASPARWKLVTTFSEWGEGTAVEPAQEWSSTSGYGQYLDVLHYNGNMP